jgi:hypothetical protein
MWWIVAGADEAHKDHMIVQAHATQLDDQTFVKNGADVLVHMVQNVKIYDDLMSYLGEKKPYYATVITLAGCARRRRARRGHDPTAHRTQVSARSWRRANAMENLPKSDRTITRRRILRVDKRRRRSTAPESPAAATGLQCRVCVGDFPV